MHRSKLSNIIIDCNDMDAGVYFWSHALGTKVASTEGPYVFLEARPGGLEIGLQHVPEPKSVKGRVHLDIRSDDVEAEVQRLEKLGARRQAQIETWWVMEDPSGNEFCVIRGSSSELGEDANTWDS